MLAFDRATLPFGELPFAGIPLTHLWMLDAAWKHGAPGCAIVVSQAQPERLRLPPDWTVREVPFG